MMPSWDQAILVQGRSDGSEATPEHMGESTLCMQALLIYGTRSMPMPIRGRPKGEKWRHCAWRTFKC